MQELIEAGLNGVGVLCLIAAAVGCLYALAAAVAVRMFARRKPAVRGAQPGLTVLKPLHGAEPDLLAKLETFCSQDYSGPVQIIFGVQDADDPAIAAVRVLQHRHPAADIALVVNTREHGANRKVSNLINMAGLIAHELVLLADSDIEAPADHFSRVVAELLEPEVGMVTCLYRGQAAGGLWSTLAAQGIDWHFIPSVIVALGLRAAQPCFGSTMAFSAATLRAIGGFEAFANHLADDYEMGHAVRALELAIVVPAYAVGHTCADATLSELVGQELRWARTIRTINPVGFLGTAVTHAVPLALAGALLHQGSSLAVGLVAATLTSRLILQIQVSYLLDTELGEVWLGPVRDMFSFAIFLASFWPGAVTWRGRRFGVSADGRLLAVKKRGL